ncbi:MAG: DUF4115 domain-containing protein [Clostridiales bacterium]|nr:DUF4115 domain-containing protein [Clostridiales bacterium]
MEGIGGILRDARDRKAVSLDEIEEATKIKKRYLLAMEQEEWNQLPGKVYAKGFLRTYARYLGLDEQSMADMFELSFAARAAEAAEALSGTDRKRHGKRQRKQRTAKQQEVDLHNKPRKKMIYVLCILSVAVLTFSVWAYKTYYLNEVEAEKQAPPPIVQPQPEPSIEPAAKDLAPDPVVMADFSIKLEAKESCWLRLKDNEALIYEGTMRPGEIQEFAEVGQVEIRIGNAGGVVMTLNGIELPAFGASGQVVTKHYAIIEGIMVDGETGETLS